MTSSMVKTASIEKKATETPRVYDLFLGCTIQNRVPFIEKSARIVFNKLNIQFKDNPHFSCCPDPVGIQSTNHHSWLLLGARNLALAEQDHLPVISFCNGCVETLKAVNHELAHHSNTKEEIQTTLGKIGKKYQGTTIVKHFIEVLHNDIGSDAIRAAVVRPLTGIKIAVHVGCHYCRPSELVQIDSPLDPQYPTKILQTIGATVVNYEEALMCCGSAVARNNDAAANGLMKRKFQSIMDASPDVIAVNCPSCFQQLESGQRIMKKEFDIDVKLPVFYITELLALAFGASSKEIGLQFHQIKPTGVLQKLGIE